MEGAERSGSGMDIGMVLSQREVADLDDTESGRPSTRLWDTPDRSWEGPTL